MISKKYQKIKLRSFLKMLIKPKGYKYWLTSGDELKIQEDAPEWAKEEVKKYLEMMDQSSGQKGDAEVIIY